MSFPRYLAALVVALIGTYLAGMIAAPHVYGWGYWPLFDIGIAAAAFGGLTLSMANVPILSFALGFVGGTLCSAFLYEAVLGHFSVLSMNQNMPLLFAGCFWFVSAVVVVVSIHVLRANIRGNAREVEAYRVSSDAVRAEGGKLTLVVLGLLAIGIAIAVAGGQLLEHQMIALGTFGVFAGLSVSTWIAAFGLFVVHLMRRPRNGTS